MNRILLLLTALAIAMPNVCSAQNTESHSLPNPFKWEKKSGEASNLAEWNERRNEISNLIQQHEIGIIPEVKREQIKARMIMTLSLSPLPWARNHSRFHRISSTQRRVLPLIHCL